MRLSRVVPVILVLLGTAPAAVAAPPPLEPIEVEREVRFALPSGVRLVDEARVDLLEDAEHLMIGVEVGGADHVAITDLHGRGYRCVTCGRVGAALKPEPFDDGKRLWFADQSGQSSGGTGDFQWSVLECRPSLVDCAAATVAHVTFPRDGLAQGAQNREARPVAGGTHVGWNEVRLAEGTTMTIGRLERSGNGYRIADPRVWNPAYALDGTVADAEPGGRFYEGGSPVLGNRLLKYGSTRTASNYEIYTLDLLTGERRALTTDLDYNEVASFSPDGRSVWYTSARGLDRGDVLTQLVRPSLIDMVSFGQLGRAVLFQNRRCLNEGWLMDTRTGQQLGGYAGQPVLLEDDWNLRRFAWFPGGTRAVTYEQRLPNRKDPEDPAKRSRVRIVRLPARTPTRPLASVPLEQTRYRELTVPAADYQGLAARQLAGTVLRGRAAGTATLTFLGVFASGSWQVSYDGYSDDGRTFVDGTESITIPNPIVAARYTVDLTARGEHPGFMKGSLEILQNRFSGSITSEVDGRRLQGIPTQASCPGLRQPALRLVARRAGATLRVRVTARVAEDATPRPVRRATVVVRKAGRTLARARTRPDGSATLRVPRRGRYLLRASAGSFKPGELRTAR